MYKLTLLKQEDCEGENKLDIFKKKSIFAEPTDYSRLLGNQVTDIYDEKNKKFEMRSSYLTSSYKERKGYKSDIKKDPMVVDAYGVYGEYEKAADIGIRPVIEFENILDIPTNGNPIEVLDDGVLEVEYGYYPQTVVSEEMEKTLEEEYRNRSFDLNEIEGHHYTSNSTGMELQKERYEPLFHASKNKCYEYNGGRYVRISTKNADQSKSFYKLTTLGVIPYSNGKGYKAKNGHAWVKVEPVKWLVDAKNKKMISEKVLAAGVPYADVKNAKANKDGFESTYVSRFMNKFMLKELEQERQPVLLGEVENKRAAALLGIDISDMKKYENEGILAYSKIGQQYKEFIKKVKEKNTHESVTK